MAKVVSRMTPDFSTQAYVIEAFKGVALVTKQFARNIFARKDIVTVQYPEDRRPYTPRFRGKHRLMQRDDKSVRCVACMLCATACPANCITIIAREVDDPTIEKAPASFDIDLLKCIYCGFCEEACPCDAIRLDSGIHTIPSYTRRDQKAGVINLMTLGSVSIAEQGGDHRAHSHQGTAHGQSSGH